MLRAVSLASALAAAFAAPSVTVGPAVHPERAQQIKEINAKDGVHWTAAPVSRFASQAPGSSRPLCGVLGSWKNDIAEGIKAGKISEFKADLTAAPIPDSFDSYINWPMCAKIINDIRDQSNCGCCWAFAGAEAASDRMCIATKGQMMMPISAQDVCFCSNFNGCDGGQITTPWEFIKNKGAVTGGQYQSSGPFGAGYCSDFSLPHCHHHGPVRNDPYPSEGQPGCMSQTSAKCPRECDSNATAPHNVFDSDKYSYTGMMESASGEEKIQQMIMAGGPVETAFSVYSDFENYAGGIYHHVSGQQVGGHAVKIVGWGVEYGTKYWIVANSWNPYWGEYGFFRIMRGNNECGIEDGVTGSPATATWNKKALLL